MTDRYKQRIVQPSFLLLFALFATASSEPPAYAGPELGKQDIHYGDEVGYIHTSATPYYDCSDQGEVPQAECEALVALYDATNGTHWTNRRGWLDASIPIPYWLGITVSGSRVTSLDLAGNNLSGRIPAALGQLASLQELVLSDNPLSGPIPLAFTQLGSLTTFAFNNTSLCEPQEQTFLDWLNGVSDVRSSGAACNSNTSKTPAEDEVAQVPQQFTLAQNYPNPFNPVTTIRFGLPEAGRVSLRVYNVLGQEVAVLVEGTLQAGWHDVRFDAAVLPSGLYFYRIEAGSFAEVRQMTLLN